MAFEASYLVDGEWTTRTLDVNDVLRHHNQQDQDSRSKPVNIEQVPVRGVLTQTVVRSPVVHWVLPAKLRDLDTNDVAFIGDEFVQIKQLRTDGHLWDIARKEGFGARIRNAIIVGSTEAFKRDHASQSTHIKNENVDGMDIDPETNGPSSVTGRVLPPQAILLQLVSGESVFLMLRKLENGGLDFILSRRRVSKRIDKFQPGMHLAVDPSSRYLAIGCSQGTFTVYALKSRAELQDQYSWDPNIRYVDSERHVQVEGVIYKIEFLHPSADDEGHIILLLLVIRKGKTRMLSYEWQTGKPLRDIRVHSRRGHLLERSRQLPLLVIPLRIKSAFVLVCEESMSICSGILEGSPNFYDMTDTTISPTSLFHGSGKPLWTAWARPVRRAEYTVSHDDIYVARTDGQVNVIETDADEEGLLKTQYRIGRLLNSTGPAFACIDFVTYYDDGTNDSGDLLISTGDSCDGGAYLVTARRAPVLTQRMVNWSPAQDFIVKSHSPEASMSFSEVSATNFQRRGTLRPDRVFTCAGKGVKGNVTEFRHGLQADIGLEMAYDAQIMDIWVMSPQTKTQVDGGGCMFLISLGDRSSVLHLSSDASDIFELGPESTSFDLSSRTVAASTSGLCQVQVTEKSMVFISGSNVRNMLREDLLAVHVNGTFVGSGTRIDLAAILGNTVVFTTRIGGDSYVRLLQPSTSEHSDDPPAIPPYADSIRGLGHYPSGATCLSLGTIRQITYVIIAEVDRGFSKLRLQPLDDTEHEVVELPFSDNDCGPIVSIVVVALDDSNAMILCGTHKGALVTFELGGETRQISSLSINRIGETPALVKVCNFSEDLIFVTCDLKLFNVSIPAAKALPSGQYSRAAPVMSQILLSDALNPKISQPVVNSVTSLSLSLAGGGDHNVVVISGQRIFLVSLDIEPKAIPRHLPINGWPSRLIYSDHLGCLVVAASINGKSALLFLDPETGNDLSRPMDKKKGVSVEYVSGLGNYNEKIFRLFEWSYVKGGKTWKFIIVCLSTGRLLVISALKDSMATSTSFEDSSDSKSTELITYWTLNKIKCQGPVYSVAGSDQGLFYCAGDVLFCQALDDVEKRFKPVAEYHLPSPAVNLMCRDGQIFALTAAHSLEVLTLEPDPTTWDSVNGREFRIVRLYGDQTTRNTLHHRTIPMLGESPFELISDKSCSVVGLWATQGTRADTFEPLFEAKLPCSVIRLRGAQCRPAWDSTRVAIPNTATPLLGGAGCQETLGLSITGSLFHFTLLDIHEWKLYRFLINLAQQSPLVCESTCGQDPLPLEPSMEPKTMMHIDGEILRRCLGDGILEELLCVGQESEEAEAKQAMFMELLQVERREEFGGDAALNYYIEQAYKKLEWALRPVLS